MAKILRQTTVIRDGMHNAFTDLQFWQGAYWVTYRKGAGHTSMDAHAVVALTHDRHRFTEISTSRVKGDVRDPKLLPLGDDRMALYYPSWIEGAGNYEVDGYKRLKPIQQYITFSSDGQSWEPVRPILERNMWLWRIRPHGGRFYGLIQNLTAPYGGDGPQRPHQLDLAVSDNLIEWQTIARVGTGLNESDIYWHADGEAWIISRTIKATNSCFATAKPPYTDWSSVELEPMVHAPNMLEHEGALYVAGRSNPLTEGEPVAPCGDNSLSIWRLERNRLVPILRIPAYGDCSYPGFIKDPAGRICLSYYSQHAYYLGVVTPPLAHYMPSDVYFAELEL